MVAITNKFYEIEQQRIDIAINTRKAGEIDRQLAELGAGVLPFDPTQAPDVPILQQISAPNYVDNSDFDYSKDAYLNSTPAGGDIAEECYNWYRQRFIKVTDVEISASPTATVDAPSGPFKAAYTYPMDFVLLNGDSTGAALSGTLTRVSDTQATLSVNAENDIEAGGVLWFGDALAETAAQALKASGHSLFAANEGANAIIPRWEKTNGWAEIGSDTEDRFDLACPLALNIVRPGLVYYFRCIVKLRTGATPGDPIRLSAGIWDATASQKRFIESANMTLSVAPVGTAGSTTYTYVVIADLDDGTSVTSDTITITNGNASLSESNYNRLTWVNTTGILRFRIYRETGGVVKRVFTITNGGQSYNDYGTDEGETPASLPSAGVVRPIAYTVSQAFTPSDVWEAVLLRYEIPPTYDTSVTTGKQWLRIAVEGQAGDERVLLIDRVSLSNSSGGWQRSSNDLSRIQTQNPSSLPPGSDQGNTGVGGGELPDFCFPLETPILTCDRDGHKMRWLPIGELDRGMFVFSGDRRVNRIQKIKDGIADKLIAVKLSNDIEFQCTPSERFITSRADKHGTRIDNLTIGDEILCWMDGRVTRATIEKYAEQKIKRTKHAKGIPVQTLILKPGKTFVVGGGAIAHNLKIYY